MYKIIIIYLKIIKCNIKVSKSNKHVQITPIPFQIFFFSVGFLLRAHSLPPAQATGAVRMEQPSEPIFTL